MQVPILSGIYTDESADFRTAYPRNLMPILKQQGISAGYLRPADGIVQAGEGPGIDRGGINWNGICYRVMGTKLVSISSDGTVAVLADVGGSGRVELDYSFDRLAIASSNKLFYWNGAALSQVVDGDLGNVIDVVFIDGYFMTTDGANIVVTELNDPMSVNPLKYGSSEADPDKIVGVLKIGREVCVINRHSLEFFRNVGGDFFPFSRVDGALVQKGAVSAALSTVFSDTVVFLGGGRNEAFAIWASRNGESVRISSMEVEQVLSKETEQSLESAALEVRIFSGHSLLYVHLPSQTFVYDLDASKDAKEPVWFVLSSALAGDGLYRARNFVWCYGKWLCADPSSTKHGYLTSEISTHYGDPVGWEFTTMILYNDGAGLIFHELELVCLTGRVKIDASPTIWASYTTDGETWSQERPISAGRHGDRSRRLIWLQQGHMRRWRAQKFRGLATRTLQWRGWTQRSRLCMCSAKITITRAQLAEFLPNNRLVAAFEDMFLQTSEAIPVDIASLKVTIGEVDIAAGSAMAAAQAALDAGSRLSDVAEDTTFAIRPSVTLTLSDIADVTTDWKIGGSVLSFDPVTRRWVAVFSPRYITQVETPSVTGFTVSVSPVAGSVINSVWLLLKPTAALAAGTITLPSSSDLFDQQEVSVSCTQAITALTVSGNGATVYGAPATLAADSAFRLRYNLSSNTWYKAE